MVVNVGDQVTVGCWVRVRSGADKGRIGKITRIEEGAMNERGRELHVWIKGHGVNEMYYHWRLEVVSAVDLLAHLASNNDD